MSIHCIYANLTKAVKGQIAKNYGWRNGLGTGKLALPPQGASCLDLYFMQTNVQTEDLIAQKTRELCEAIVQQPEFKNIRRQLDTFMADPKAQQQYESLSDKGRHLQHKQSQGLQLAPAEISAFDSEREAFFRNPVAKGFVDAQEAMHHIQEEVNQYLTKTFELGRVPAADELGGCCGGHGGHGCGCEH